MSLISDEGTDLVRISDAQDSTEPRQITTQLIPYWQTIFIIRNVYLYISYINLVFHYGTQLKSLEIILSFGFCFCNFLWAWSEQVHVLVPM